MVRDSIVDGPDEALERAAQLKEKGVEIIDLGGRSITADVPMIGDEEERARLEPVAVQLRDANITFSIDTWSPVTAKAALNWGVSLINFTGQDVPSELLDDIARAGAGLILTYMPYGDAYQIRSREYAGPGADSLDAIIEFFKPRVKAARSAGIAELILDPNLGIIHPQADDYEKIHCQLNVVWQAAQIRELDCPILMYAARKPERLARIMMASAVLHAQPEYIRTHEPQILQELLRVSGLMNKND